MKTIYLHPGYIQSVDGDEHYIGARQLAELYGVSIMDCKVVRHLGDNDHGCSSSSDSLHLYPTNNKYEKVV